MAATRRVTIRPSGVTFVNSAQAGTELFKTAQDRIRLTTGQCFAYFRYRIEEPRNLRLTEAEHVVRTEDERPGSPTLTSRRMDPPGRRFREINYNNRPTATAAGSSDEPVTQVGTNQVWRFNHTDDAAAVIGDFLILRLTTSEAARVWLRGPRDKRGWPRLILTYEPYPRTPTDLSPSRTVSVAKPWLRWLGHPDAAQVQVQFADPETTFDPITGFATTVHDTGAVTLDSSSNGMEMDLDTVASGWSGIPVDGELEWTLRQNFSTGWSNWADPVSVPRVGKGQPVITNPGAVTADASFPVTWTPPAGQTGWQVLVDLDYRGEEWDQQANSGRRAGTDGSWTPDIGGDDPDTSYRVRVRTFDDVDREPTPGDPIYGEDTALTTFTPTDTVAGLTDLQLVQAPGLPAVDATWARASGVADEVVLHAAGYRRMREPGTDSGIRLWTFPPNRDLAVRGRAIVNGEQSEDALVFPLRLEVEGMWVVDPATGRGFRVRGLGIAISYGGNTATYTPHSAAALVHRVTSRRGAEGTVTGWLGDWPGRTAEEQLDDLWWLRDRPAKELRLLAGDLNIPFTMPDVFAVFDAEQTFVDRVEHRVEFVLSQTRNEHPRST